MQTTRVSVTLSADDRAEIEQIQKAFNRKHGTDLSMAEVIRTAVRYYGQRLNYVETINDKTQS